MENSSANEIQPDNLAAPVTPVALPVRALKRKRYVTLMLSEGLSVDGQSEVANLIAAPADTVVNCAGISDFPESWVETFKLIHRELKAAKKKLRFLYIDPNHKLKLATGNLAMPELYPKGLAEALQDFETEEGSPLNNNFIKAFVHATVRVLFIQAKTQCQQGKIFVKAQEKGRLLGAVSGLIEVVGPAFSYAVAISFPNDTFLKVMSRMLDMQLTQVTKELEDGATEMINIIYGQAKLVLNDRKSGFRPNFPVLIHDGQVEGLKFKAGELVTLDKGKTIVVPLQTDLGDLYVEVWFPEKHLDTIKSQ